MEIEIRKLHDNEIDLVSEVFAESFNAAGVEENWTTETAMDYLFFRLEHPDLLFFIALDDNKIVGGAAGDIRPWCSEKILYDFELFIKPEYQGKGIAKKLLNKLVSEAKEKYNIIGITGIADGKNDFPISWYKKMGIKPTRWQHIYGEVNSILDYLNKKG